MLRICSLITNHSIVKGIGSMAKKTANESSEKDGLYKNGESGSFGTMVGKRRAIGTPVVHFVSWGALSMSVLIIIRGVQICTS